MSPKVIVTDLDRTLTGPDLAIDPEALRVIAALRAQGIRVVLATGRRLDELLRMGIADAFDGVVAENGALVAVASERIMDTRHPGFGTEARAALGEMAASFRWGRVVGSGPREHADAVRARLDAAGVPHALEFNAEDVMLLPDGVDKASGAALCLRRLGLGPEDAWAIGDGENDVSMLGWARVGIAPANAAATAKAAASVHATGAFSRGFVEVMTPLLARKTVTPA